MLLRNRLLESLLERDDEIAEITRLVDLAAQGRGSVAVVTGPAGIGKTRLCEVAREVALARGLLTLTACASELETASSFAVARQLLERPLAEFDPGTRDQVLAGPASWAAPLFGGTGPPDADAPTPDAAARTMHGLLWAMSNLAAERSILVCVDDAQWGDSPSLRWLAYLVKRVAQLPLLVLLSLRTDEPMTDPALNAILGDAGARVLELRPLSANATGSLLQDSFALEPDDEFVTACHSACGGNPFLLRELLFTLAAANVVPTRSRVEEVRQASPPSVSRFLGARMERLERSAIELARAVAVLGDGAAMRDAAALAGLTVDGAIVSATALIGADIVTEERDENGDLRLSFKHPLFRASVYGDLDLADRRKAHQSAARLLVGRGADASEVAAHVLTAGGSSDPEVLAAVRAAGVQALATGAPDVAVRCLRCVRESEHGQPDPELTFQLGVAEARSGSFSAIEHLEDALGRLTDPRARAQAGAELAFLRLTMGASDAVNEAMETAIQAAEEVDRELAFRLQATLLPTLRAMVSTTPLRRKRLQAASGLAGETPAERALLAIAAADHAATGAQPVEYVRRLSERAAAEGQLLRDEISGSASVIGLAAALIFSDQLRQAANHLTAAINGASARGSVFSFALLSSWRSFARLRLGDVPGGLADAEAARRVSDEHGLVLDRPFTLACLANLLREQDQPSAGSELLEAFPLSEFADAGSASMAFHARGLSRVARGELAAGLEDLLECGRHLARWEAPNPVVLPWRSDAARVLHSLGDQAQAQALADESLALAQRYRAPSAIGIALHGCGAIAPTARAATLIGEAAAMLEATDARLAHVDALVAWGTALRARGDRADARAALTRALDLAERIGALAAARRARAELVASGARPRRAATVGIEALTPSERQIVEMAAAGWPNRKIAEALFLTVRTVETHLTASYRKLGIRSRSQLPGIPS